MAAITVGVLLNIMVAISAILETIRKLSSDLIDIWNRGQQGTLVPDDVVLPPPEEVQPASLVALGIVAMEVTLGTPPPEDTSHALLATIGGVVRARLLGNPGALTAINELGKPEKKKKEKGSNG